MVSSNLLLFFVLVFNLWIWRVVEFNIFIGLLLVASTVLLWLLIKEKSKNSFLFLILFFVLVAFQWQTTDRISLTNLTNDEQRLQQVRLRAHPPVYFKIGDKTIWIPTGNWFELRKEAVAFYKIQANFADMIDPNLYFFANHPRERVGVKEFEKFPYLLLPAFIIGILSLTIKELKKLWPVLIPFVLISFIGNNNPYGPFSLFPFLAVITAKGVENILIKVNKLPRFPRRIVIPLSLFIFILVFVQVISYAKF